MAQFERLVTFFIISYSEGFLYGNSYISIHKKVTIGIVLGGPGY